MTDANNHPNSLRYVLYERDGAWIAMCVERYVGAQGCSREEALRGLQIVYRAELDESLKRTGEPFGGVPAAPEKFREMFMSDDPAIERSVIYDDGMGAGFGAVPKLAAYKLAA